MRTLFPSLTTKLKSPPLDSLPLAYPQLPSVEAIETTPGLFSEYEKQWNEVHLKNQKRAQKMVRISGYCAFLNGFTHMFGPNLDKHYAWCPLHDNPKIWDKF